jgi:hypothetical protein
VSGAVYDEWFYFNFKDLRKEQIAEAHLKVSVFDYNFFRSNELIGIYQVFQSTFFLFLRSRKTSKDERKKE